MDILKEKNLKRRKIVKNSWYGWYNWLINFILKSIKNRK